MVNRSAYPLILAALVAATPGVVILQVLPRLASSEGQATAGLALGIMGTLLPIMGALLGGLLLRALALPRGWYGPILGIAAQFPALPGYLQLLSDVLGPGFYVDAGVYTVLFLSYAVLSGTLAGIAGNAGREDGNVFPGERSRRWWAQLVGAFVFLATALATLGNPQAPLSYPFFTGLGALSLAAQMTIGHRAWRLRTGQALLVASTGVVVLTAVVLLGSSML